MESLTLINRPHPILPAKYDVLVHHTWQDGETIRAILMRNNFDSHQEIIISLNDRLLAVEEWDTICPAPGSIINVQATVSGGDGSNPVAAILTIAVMVFAPALAFEAYSAMGGTMGATAFASSTLGTAMAAATTAAGSMVISSLFRPSQNTSSPKMTYDDSPTYSLTGGSNAIRPYEPLQIIFGTHRIFPDYGAKPYTEFRGGDQYLYQLFNLGLSSISTSDYRIGTTSINEYDDVEFRWGVNGQPIPGFPGNVDTTAGAKLIRGDWVQRTTSDDTTRIAVDLEGICYWISPRKGIEPTAVIIEAYYASTGTSNWVPFAARTIIKSYTNTYASLQYNGQQYSFSTNMALVGSKQTITAYAWSGEFGSYYEATATWVSTSFATADMNGWGHPEAQPIYGTSASTEISHGASQKAQRRTLEAFVASGKYDVKVRLTSARNLITNAEISADGSMDKYDYAWTVLRSYQEDTTNYAGQTRLGLIIKASGQLNGSVNTFSCLASASCSYYNGSTWVWGKTSNPAWWYLDFALGHCAGDGTKLYGCHLPGDQIDFTGIIAWAAFCDTEGLSCNMVIDIAQSASETLQAITRCGLGSPSWGSGKLGVIWDKRNASPVAAFGMSNIIKGSFSVEYLAENLADEIIVNYVNANDDYKNAQVRKLTPGTVAPANSVTIALIGCTNETMAGKYANVMAAQQYYRRRNITWETDFEGMICQRGDVVLLQHDLTQWGYSGRLLAVEGSILTLDRAVPRNGQTEYAMLVEPDGTMTTYKLVPGVNGIDSDTLTLTSLPSIQEDQLLIDHRWFFSPLATPGKLIKITGVVPVSESRIRIIATDEDPAYYAAWDGAWNSPVKPSLLTNTTPVITGCTINERLGLLSGDVIGTVISITFNVNGPFDSLSGQWRIEDGAWATFSSNTPSFEIHTPLYGSFTINASPILALYKGTLFSYSTTIFGKTAAPSTPQNLTAAITDSGITLSWDPVTDLDLKEYRVFVNGQQVDTVTGASWIYTFTPTGLTNFSLYAVDTTGNISIAATTSVTINAPAAPSVSSEFSSNQVLLKITQPASQLSIDYYEVFYTNESAQLVSLGKTYSTVFSTVGAWVGSRLFSVKATDISGNVSPAGTVPVTIIAPSAVILTAQTIDNNVLLFWTDATGSLPITSYEVRKGDSYAMSELIGKKSGNFTTVFETISGNYTYWITGIDAAGNYGASSQRAVKVSEPPNYVLKVSTDSTFSGTKSNAIIQENGTLLLPVNLTETFQAHFTTNAWTTPQAQINAGYPIYAQPGTGSGYYEEIIDMEEVLPSMKITLAYSGEVIAGSPTIQTIISTKELAGDAWTDADNPTEVYVSNFQYIKVKFIVTGAAGSLYQINSLNVKIDAKLKDDAGSVTALSSDTLGTVVNFSPNSYFIDVTSIVLTVGGTNPTTPVTAIYDYHDANLDLSYTVTSGVMTISHTAQPFVTGQTIRLNVLSGGASDGTYTITGSSTNSYTVAAPVANTSGTVSVYPQSMRIYAFNSTNGVRATAPVSWSIKGY